MRVGDRAVGDQSTRHKLRVGFCHIVPVVGCQYLEALERLTVKDDLLSGFHEAPPKQGHKVIT